MRTIEALAIQMVDLQSQYQRLKVDIDNAMQQVIDQANFINGAQVKEFSTHLVHYLGVNHAIPCANGTDALQLALMALDLKPGDEVITSNFTFIATVEVIALLGLKPVLVDVLPDTFCLNPDLVEKAITSRTKVILPVHLFGQGADMVRLIDIAKRHHLYLIEDAAQCLGAEYITQDEASVKLGTMGDIGCTSFFPSKNLGCFGDGGACFTNDDELAKRIREIANHGSKIKYYHDRVGVNSRLDTLQAAVLNVKLPHLDDFNQRRQQAAHTYSSQLSEIKCIVCPAHHANSEHIFHQYTLRILDGKRDALKLFLQERGIPTMVYYPVPIHRQSAFVDLIDKNKKFPISDLLADEVLSLPMHTELTSDQLELIISSIKEFFNHE